MRFRHLTPADYRVVPWANGRGQTTELLRLEHDSGRLQLRLSVADVVENGPFSQLPGIDRVLTLIEGEGFDLDFGDAAQPRSARPFEPIGFSGDWQPSATNLLGPSRDFNVMTSRGDYIVEVSLLPQGPSMWPQMAMPSSGNTPGMSCFYVANGSAIVGALGLYCQVRELLLVEGHDPIDIDAIGSVLAVRLEPRGALT